MYGADKILALIPARGGSRGIKKKNIANLEGYPLIAYSIEASIGSKYIDNTIVSTDSTEIAEIAEICGASVPFMRPAELATDDSKTIDAVLHAIHMLEKEEQKFDVLVLLQPTQPLRTASDIDKAIEFFFENDKSSLASVSLVEDHPLLIRSVDSENRLLPLLNENSTCRRQDMKKYYKVNGCIYINCISELSNETSFNDNKMAFIMKKEHSVDIDEMKDLCLAGFYLNENVEKRNLQNVMKPERQCGKCLKKLQDGDSTYSLENEMKRITGGLWWCEELDYEVVCNTLCRECRDQIMQKYFPDFTKQN